MSEDAGRIGELLRAFLTGPAAGLGDVRIGALRRAGSGSSSENWLFEAEWSEAGERRRSELVLRRAPANEIVVTTREAEFDLLRALGRSSLPVPRAMWMDRDGRFLERPAMIVERRPGTDDRFLLMKRNAGRLDPETRLSLARQMVDLLAELHGLDRQRLDLPVSIRATERESLAAAIDRAARESLAQEVEPSVELRLAEWWLRDNRPAPPARKVLVHGDFRPANVLVSDGRITALLDWELAFVGDPLADLGWYLAPTYRDEHFIDGLWSERDFLERYERLTDTSVDREALRFWMVFAHYKLATMANASMKAFLAGDHNRIASRPGRIVRPMLEMIADDGSHRRWE